MNECTVTYGESVSFGLRPKLKRAVNFYANLLMDPRMVRGLLIDIEIDKTFRLEGECFDEDDHKNPRFFTIKLRGKRGDEDIFKTLGHEMVHVKQFARNELVTGVMSASKNGIVIGSTWMGKPWKPKAKEHGYFDSPWEIEAYGREVGLYKRWRDYDG